jgi:hypothetical protein
MENTTMKNLSENCALELMREGRPLMRMHTTDGLRWTDGIAQYGLFPSCTQTFKLRNNWRAAGTA